MLTTTAFFVDDDGWGGDDWVGNVVGGLDVVQLNCVWLWREFFFEEDFDAIRHFVIMGTVVLI